MKKILVAGTLIGSILFVGLGSSMNIREDNTASQKIISDSTIDWSSYENKCGTEEGNDLIDYTIEFYSSQLHKLLEMDIDTTNVSSFAGSTQSAINQVHLSKEHPMYETFYNFTKNAAWVFMSYEFGSKDMGAYQEQLDSSLRNAENYKLELQSYLSECGGF